MNTNNSNLEKYDTEFYPLTYTLDNGRVKMWHSSFLEVGTECCRYPGLRGDENTILVYSALLTIREKPDYESLIMSKEICMNMYFYDLPFISRMLNMTTEEVDQSIQKLETLELIAVLNCSFPSIGIAIKKDLRYCSGKKKHVFRVYDRIFSYPKITKEMALLYSYYLHLNETATVRRYRKVSYPSLIMTVGFYKERIIRILNELENIGLITVLKEYDPVLVIVDVNFAYEQEEEWQFEWELNKSEKQRIRKLQAEKEGEIEASLRNALKNYETWKPKNADDPDPFDIESRGCHIYIDAKNLTPSQFHDLGLSQFAAYLSNSLEKENITDWSINIQSTESVD